MNQRSGVTYSVGISGTESVPVRSLIKWLISAQLALEGEHYHDAALHWELAAEFFKNEWSPNKPLVFRSRDIGL